MKKQFILIAIFTINIFINIYPQTGKSPYPIIFVHGLNSNDSTWKESIDYITDITEFTNPYSNNGIFYAVLNISSGTNYSDDVKTSFSNLHNNLNNNDIYCVNFNNAYDSETNNILLHQDQNADNESESNESAIAKQGYALGIMIDSVLNKTGAEKVILFGHSMGGLAIREYLQKTDATGRHIWWIDPDDNEYGHKVAKVVTFGTPHGGSDLSDVPSILSDWLSDIDTKSEAVRDLRNSNDDEDDAIYLFGDNENISFVTNPYNMDVNCDGDEVDDIKGLNNEIFNQNIEYTWITSKWTIFFDGDGVVKLKNQYVHSIGDTLKTDKLHTDEPKDTYSIVRGLDEPDNSALAYQLTPSHNFTTFNRTIQGFITYQMNNVESDVDFYKINLLYKGLLSLNLSGENSGINRLTLLNESNEEIEFITDFPNSITQELDAGIYYIRIDGTAASATWGNPYTLTINYDADKIQLNVKAFLEGAYSSTGMITELNTQDYIPLTQPYNKAPWNYTGNETVTSIPDEIVDWVLVELRSGIENSTKVATRAAFIKNDGWIVDTDGASPLSFYGISEGNYYIVVYHRNHLSIMSATMEYIGN
jgi:pimeloyl-ACP methyl ester carboxylesterase